MRYPPEDREAAANPTDALRLRVPDSPNRCSQTQGSRLTQKIPPDRGSQTHPTDPPHTEAPDSQVPFIYAAMTGGPGAQAQGRCSEDHTPTQDPTHTGHTPALGMAWAKLGRDCRPGGLVWQLECWVLGTTGPLPTAHSLLFSLLPKSQWEVRGEGLGASGQGQTRQPGPVPDDDGGKAAVNTKKATKKATEPKAQSVAGRGAAWPEGGSERPREARGGTSTQGPAAGSKAAQGRRCLPLPPWLTDARSEVQYL
ncbi:hypothetical protein P7K49_005844 [Saguinus oedipus]|uniref:Uncharacterized protein n=1 Tax=Saguinus oedipus TaxID=9490 RepID=A0ABQ9W0Q1_SAGOE|nr:hypothetical protein P7K49_005844 [Saguinus oedipus]